MSTLSPGDFPIDPNTTDGTELSDRLNRLKLANHSNYQNATRPPDIAAGGLWTRLVSATKRELMMFDGTTDHVIGTIDNGLLRVGGNMPGADAFSASAYYITGQYVTYSGRVYKAIALITPAPFNPAQWQDVTNTATFKIADEPLDNATESAAGVARFATQAESTQTGNTLVAMTPARVENAIRANSLKKIYGAALSGGALQIIGIPSGAKRIIVSLHDVSLSTANYLTLLLGSAVGYPTSINSIQHGARGGTTSVDTWTNSGLIFPRSQIADRIDGVIEFTLVDFLTWKSVANWARTRAGDTAPGINSSVGYGIAMPNGSTHADRLYIHSDNGAGTFTSGWITVYVE